MAPGSIVNIAGTTPVDDPAYRYKMPLVYGKIEGRGNGIKTVIPNVSEVAMSLHRSPAEVNKFFGCELGAQTTYAADTDRAVVNGAHTDAVLQQLIHKYVEGFVLCPNCRLPETAYKIKNDVVWHRCAACGAKEMVDMEHKLCTFILAQDKKEKRDAKAKEKKKNKEKKEKGEDAGSDDAVEKKEKKSKKDKKDKDKDKEKKKKKDKKKKEKKSEDGSKGSDESAEDEEGADDAYAFAEAIEGTQKFLNSNPDASAKDIVEVVINQQMASALKSHERLLIYIRAVFSPDDVTLDFFKNKELAKHTKVIAGITQNAAIMQRHLIAAAEWLCMDKYKMFPVMLKEMYELDLVEEDVLLEWAAEGRSDYTLDAVDEEARAMMRAEAEPLVVWLQEDSDSESDDE